MADGTDKVVKRRFKIEQVELALSFVCEKET